MYTLLSFVSLEIVGKKQDILERVDTTQKSDWLTNLTFVSKKRWPLALFIQFDNYVTIQKLEIYQSYEIKSPP